MVEYKSVLVTNNTKDCKVVIYFYHRYDPVCFLSSMSKFVSPGTSYLHRCEDNFKFKIQTIYQKRKNIVVYTRKWVRDTHFNISGITMVVESNLDDHQIEKTVCIRKLNVSKETSLDEDRNLYEITGAAGAEITNGVVAIGRNAVIASGGGAVFSLAPDAEKQLVDGVDVTLKEAVGHAVTGAIIGGVTATAVGTVSLSCNGSTAGQLAPSLSKNIPVEKYIKLDLANKGSESVIGTVTGVIGERLDEEQENRPIGKHVEDRGKQLVGKVLVDLGNGAISSTVSQITNPNNDRSRRSHSENLYGKSQFAHSLSILSTKSGIKTNLSSFGRTARSISSNKRYLSASSSKGTFSASFTRTTHSARLTQSSISGRVNRSSKSVRFTHSANYNKKKHLLSTHSSRSNRNPHLTSAFTRAHSAISGRDKRFSISDRNTQSASSNKRNNSFSSSKGTHLASSTNKNVISNTDCIDRSARSDKITNVGNSCCNSDLGFNTDSECRVLGQDSLLKWDKYTVKAIYKPPKPKEGIANITTFSDPPVQLECVSPTNARFKYLSDKWFLRMIVKFKLNGDIHVEKTTKSVSAVCVPMDAKDVTVYFQILRFFKMWYDVKKWNRFENKWYDEPHIFRYETPPEQRVFTLGGSLCYEGVINVTDERHGDVTDM